MNINNYIGREFIISGMGIYTLTMSQDKNTKFIVLERYNSSDLEIEPYTIPDFMDALINSEILYVPTKSQLVFLLKIWKGLKKEKQYRMASFLGDIVKRNHGAYYHFEKDTLNEIRKKWSSVTKMKQKSK